MIVKTSPINRWQLSCKVSYNGVLLTGYKQMCREGYVWVPWRRKCFKQNTLK